MTPATKWYPSVLSVTYGGMDFTTNVATDVETALLMFPSNSINQWKLPGNMTYFGKYGATTHWPGPRATTCIWKITNYSQTQSYMFKKTSMDSDPDPSIVIQWFDPNNGVDMSTILSDKPQEVINNITVLAAFWCNIDITKTVADMVSGMGQIESIANLNQVAYDVLTLTIKTSTLTGAGYTLPDGVQLAAITIVFAENYQLIENLAAGNPRAYAIKTRYASPDSDNIYWYNLPVTSGAFDSSLVCLSIDAAFYGGANVTYATQKLYTNYLTSRASAPTWDYWSWTPSNSMFGWDPAPGIVKEFICLFSLAHRVDEVYATFGGTTWWNFPMTINRTSSLFMVSSTEGNQVTFDLNQIHTSGLIFPSIDWYPAVPQNTDPGYPDFVPATLIKSYWSTKDCTDAVNGYLKSQTDLGWTIWLLNTSSLGSEPSSGPKTFFVFAGWWWNNTWSLNLISPGTQVSDGYKFRFPPAAIPPNITGAASEPENNVVSITRPRGRATISMSEVKSAAKA